LNVVFELVDPAKFVADYTLKTVERYGTERFGLSSFPKFRKLRGAG